jgi:hypothetical protein
MLSRRQSDFDCPGFAEGGETSKRRPKIGERGIVAVVQDGRFS